MSTHVTTSPVHVTRSRPSSHRTQTHLLLHSSQPIACRSQVGVERCQTNLWWWCARVRVRGHESLCVHTCTHAHAHSRRPSARAGARARQRACSTCRDARRLVPDARECEKCDMQHDAHSATITRTFNACVSSRAFCSAAVTRCTRSWRAREVVRSHRHTSHHITHLLHSVTPRQCLGCSLCRTLHAQWYRNRRHHHQNTIASQTTSLRTHTHTHLCDAVSACACQRCALCDLCRHQRRTLVVVAGQIAHL
jgi:hypothetical protein